MRIILVFHWNLNRFLCKHDLYRLSIHWVRKWSRMLKVCKIEPGSRNMNLIWNWFINVSQKYNLVLIWILYIFSQALLLEEIFIALNNIYITLKPLEDQMMTTWRTSSLELDSGAGRTLVFLRHEAGARMKWRNRADSF